MAAEVGQRLRAVRQTAGMPLAEVQQLSEGEFKASVLAAYERGERWISVPRLSRLAHVYKVPLSELLPGTVAVQGRSVADRAPRPGDLVVDTAVLDRANGAEAVRLRQFCRLITNQRGAEPSDGLLRLRRCDLAAIATILGVASDEVAWALDNLRRPARSTVTNSLCDSPENRRPD